MKKTIIMIITAIAALTILAVAIAAGGQAKNANLGQCVKDCVQGERFGLQSATACVDFCKEIDTGSEQCTTELETTQCTTGYCGTTTHACELAPSGHTCAYDEQCQSTSCLPIANACE